MNGLAQGIALPVLLGLAQALAGWRLTARFAAAPSPAPARQVPVTILKPLCGDEPLLEAALSTHCRQNDWPCQIVFGVQDPRDTALAVVARVRAKFPDADIQVVIDPTEHGPNRKIGNLINMLPAARHDLLVIADSDLHVRPDFLERIVAALEQPGCGLVTTPYAGRPGRPGLVGNLGAIGITQYFLPGALLARGLGRQDCLGATMALRRGTLERIGGLQALVTHLADDNALGRKVRNLGLSIGLAHTVPATTVPEARLADLFRHELRWARTIRTLVPAAFAGSFLQFPLVWAALAVLFSAGASWAFFLFAAVWAVRGAVSRGIERALAPLLPGLAFRTSFWLLPLREVMSVAVMIASYGGHGVDWRGRAMRAGAAVDLSRPPAPVSPCFVASRPVPSGPASPKAASSESGPKKVVTQP